MDIQAKRKWMIVGIILLLAVAIAVGTSDIWKNAGTGNRKNGYVAVIRIDGPIYGGPEADSILNGGSGVTSEELMKEFQEARKDPEAKAILVRINSPGGSTGATQEIAEEMDKIRSSGKPIVVSMGDMCASAGYWLASKGNYILLLPLLLPEVLASIWTTQISKISWINWALRMRKSRVVPTRTFCPCTVP